MAGDRDKGGPDSDGLEERTEEYGKVVTVAPAKKEGLMGVLQLVYNEI
jgi:hypothetical protein